MEHQRPRDKDIGETVSISQEAVIELEDTDAVSEELANRTLVGKILSKKMLNKGAVRAICSAAWGEASEVKVSDMGLNMFLFTFPSEEIIKNIMARSPWAVMNYIMSLQRWSPEVAVAEINFNKVPIWVQIHGLPFGAMTVINASKIMKLVGEIMEVEDPLVNGVLLRSFMRARINFDIQNPLPTGCWVPRKNHPKTWIMFRYEKLQGFCYSCGVIGHEQKDCGRPQVMTAICKEIPLYGVKLSVPPAKALNTLLKEQQRWRRGSESATGSGEGASYRKEEEGSSNHGGIGGNRKEVDDTLLQGGLMGQERIIQGAGVQSTMNRSRTIDPSEAISFIRHQQSEDWESLKSKMGPVVLTPWYEHIPGSHLPPKKVFRLQGTRGYSVENVVCVDSEAEGDRLRTVRKEVQEDSQKILDLGEAEGDRSECTLGQDKGKRVVGESPILERGEEWENIIKICLEGVRPDKGLVNPPSLTLVDIVCDLPRTGLGPECMEDLGFQTEDIGLQQPVVLQDYISPPRYSDGPIEVVLSPGSIDKCRRACSSLKPKGSHQMKAQNKKSKILHERCKECNWIQNRTNYREVEKKKKLTTMKADSYLVEFPPENEGSKETLTKGMELDEELQLAADVRKSLSLKRGRLSIEEGEEEDKAAMVLYKEEGRLLKYRKGDLGNRVGPGSADELCSLKAEEAGCAMPPTSQ